jgi:hypothetical protein
VTSLNPVTVSLAVLDLACRNLNPFIVIALAGVPIPVSTLDSAGEQSSLWQQETYGASGIIHVL